MFSDFSRKVATSLTKQLKIISKFGQKLPSIQPQNKQTANGLRFDCKPKRDVKIATNVMKMMSGNDLSIENRNSRNAFESESNAHLISNILKFRVFRH